MKIKSVFLYAIAIMFSVSCNMEDSFEQQSKSDYKFSFTAYVENEPESKTTLGTSSAGRPQTFWEDGDKISVFSSGIADESVDVSFEFSTELTADAPSAVFKYNGKDFPEGNYLAMYPYKASRPVSFDAQPDNRTPKNYDGDAYRVAQADISSSQTLVPGGFDRSAMIMTAYSEGLNKLKFKNAVALVKFKVSSKDVISGKILAAEKISGRYRADILVETLEPVIVDYGKETYTYVNFTAPGNAPLLPDVDYYVAVRPTVLTQGFHLMLNGNIVKSYPEVIEFKRNTIYDLGTIATPKGPLELTFDFTDADAMAGWPTTEKSQTDPAAQITLPYVLDGVTYNFISSRPLNVATLGWAYNRGDGLLNPKQCYLGFPVVEGYALTTFHYTLGSNNGANYMITGAIAEETDDPVPVAGGETQSDSSAKEFTFNLTDTAPGTLYWMKVWNKPSIITSMTLTYIPMSAVNVIQVRCGTYNLKVVKNSDSGEYAWDKRKPRLKKSIYENGFDVFGVNECNTKMKEFVNSELSKDYNIKFFSPYSQNGEGDDAQGLLYKKSFALLDWHYFWLSETPDVMTANDPNDTATYNRGGCCGTLEHKATGIKFFFMVTHGAKNMEVRDKYAYLYIDMEKKYNPNGYPSFFVGDMNARPKQNSTATYLTYWKDVYLEVGSENITGPFSTYNHLDTSVDLNSDPRRIDYIYYRDAIPLNYVCNDKTYDGYYASDHLPVYSDILITNPNERKNT